MIPPDPDMVFDDLHFNGARPSTPPQEGAAPKPQNERDWLDAIEAFDRLPPASRPVFFPEAEEDSITPHTTTDDF